MYRMYKITLGDDRISNECSYISYSNIDSILDCSADHVSCDVIQKIPSSDVGFIKKLYEKVKPGGTIMLTILDLAKISKDYINNNITGQQFLSQAANLSTAISLEDIYTTVSQNISIKQIKHEDNSIIVTLAKLGI